MSCFISDYDITGKNTVALEDSIMLKDQLVTAGSKILEGFISPFSATVADRLVDNLYPIAGKTTMDEFGIPSIAADQKTVPGAIQAVANGATEYALCNDIFGRYRRQAAENGCCYIHPTYGTVSRFGLIPMVSSMDQIGVVCKNLPDGFTLLSHIAGKDPKDGAMFTEEHYSYTSAHQKIRVGIPGAVIQMADPSHREAIESFTAKFQTVDMTLEYFDSYKQVMYILSCAEISNNINRYDGIKFGYRTPSFKGINDLYIKTRSEGFGIDTKLTALMGAMVLSQDQYVPWYEKAMKIRRLIIESLRFDAYDIIVLPCKISEDPYENLSLYALPTLAGLPSVSFTVNGHGIQLIANVKREDLLLSAWEVCKA
ncbi:MAG: hypothetical protein KBA53_07965 [Thermoclostridium sp.]|nr:hypothetical protein [Thermoclostridium sp.]